MNNTSDIWSIKDFLALIGQLTVISRREEEEEENGMMN
jgi:hypothetical protein